MGMWEFLDEIEEDVESGVEAVGRGLGEVAGKAAHAIGDGLDAVGLHSAAEAVDGFGDSVADTLGAQVGEARLGQTDDPAKLVHGDAGALRAAAGHLAKFGAAFTKTADGLKRIDTAHWTGAAADKFRAGYHQHPTQWSDAAEACTRASGALTAYADVVQWAQDQAAEAAQLFAAAKQQSERARQAYNQQVIAGSPPSVPFTDPGIEGAKRAEQLLSDARTRRTAEGDRAKVALEQATAKAPAEPRFTDRLLAEGSDLLQEGGDGLVHFYGGIVKGAGGILKFGRSLNPLDPYNMTHPAEYVAGLSGTAAGLLHTVNHPLDLVEGMLGDGWGSDPFEALGKLVPNVALAVASDGAGAAGERVAAVGEEAAESAAMTAGRGAEATAGREATAAERPAAFTEHPAEPLPDDFGPAGHDFGPPEKEPATPPGWSTENPHEAAFDKSELVEGPRDVEPPRPADPADYRDPDHHTAQADHDAFNERFGPENQRLLQEQLDRAPDVGLANEEIRALDHYTGRAHQDLNQALWHDDAAALGTMDPEIREMVSGLNKLPSYEGEVFRGIEVGDMDAFLDRYEVGNVVKEPAFTSSDTTVPYSGNVQMTIESTTGRDISWLKDPSVGQQEVLFPPGSHFEVLERKFDEASNTWKFRLKDMGR
ncbi:putative T7SS-secreted protein [Amycolatopsis sp. cmx-4-68]|uniref:putative T7SS-secreted protein n=1 Tax=Amycolatopsis sp. cmx-4-68 TaxID=2790938 RepID=UPI00397A929D